MHCSVQITTNIVGDATAVGATVNQCNDSLGGGGVLLRACSPDPAATSGATIDQCNNSVNGGGSSLTCLVTAGSTSSDALRVIVSQCNYSANGGGSLVVCTVGMTTNISPAVVVPPVEEEEETPVIEDDEETTPTVGETEEQRALPGSVNPFRIGAAAPEVLANTGAIPASPTGGLLLATAGILSLMLTRVARERRAALR